MATNTGACPIVGGLVSLTVSWRGGCAGAVDTPVVATAAASGAAVVAGGRDAAGAPPPAHATSSSTDRTRALRGTNSPLISSLIEPSAADDGASVGGPSASRVA